MDAMKDMNGMRPDEVDRAREAFESAMRVARKIFGREAFPQKYSAKKSWRNPINRALFECIAVNIAKMAEHDQEQLVHRGGLVRDAFIHLMNEHEFEQAISVSTGYPPKVKLRFRRMREILRGVLDA